MSADRWQRLEAVYHEALARPPHERTSFLDQACAGNENFRRELEQLLAWDARAGTFLDEPLLTAAGEPSSAFSPAHDPELAPGVNVMGGRITYEAVAEAHGLDYTPLDDALAAGVV